MIARPTAIPDSTARTLLEPLLGSAEPAAGGWRSALGGDRQRIRARELLVCAAQRLDAPSGPFAQDAQGAPLPNGSWHWAVSHSRGLVAACIARGQRFGLDLERLDRPFSRNVAKRMVLLGAEPTAVDDVEGLCTAWTRVEAVLKLTRAGLGGIGRVRLPRGRDLRRGDVPVRFGGEELTTRVVRWGDAVLCAALRGAIAPELRLRTA